MSIRNLILALSIPFLGACATSKVSMLMIREDLVEAPRPDIEVFSNASLVKKPYDEIALITSDSRGWSSLTEVELTKDIIEKAKSIGANGLILQPTTESASGAIVSGSYVSLKYTTVKGVGIRWKK